MTHTYTHTHTHTIANKWAQLRVRLSVSASVGQSSTKDVQRQWAPFCKNRSTGVQRQSISRQQICTAQRHPSGSRHARPGHVPGAVALHCADMRVITTGHRHRCCRSHFPAPPRHVLMSDSHILAVVSRSRGTQVRHHWYTTHAHCAASRLSTPSPSPSHKHTHLVLGTRTNTHTHTHTHDVLESRGTTNRKSHNVSEDKNGRREARAQHTHTHTHTRVRARGRRKATK